jgi:hypothetical protein
LIDEALLKYYRRLLRAGFQYAGSIENPSIFLDTVREKPFRVCGRPGDYLRLYINVRDDAVSEVKYLCTCAPAPNVAIEILCTLVAGKPLADLGSLTEDSFCEVLGSDSADLRDKAKGLLELLSSGIARYRAETARDST